MRRYSMMGLAALLPLLLAGCGDDTVFAKPVIYLYPEQEIEVSVQLDYDGE